MRESTSTSTSAPGSFLDHARTVLSNWAIVDAQVVPVPVGLINRTFQVTRPGGVPQILQCVNPIFSPDVHDNIEAVTRHIATRGRLKTPELIRTQAGELYATNDGEIWRLMTYIDGVTYERVPSIETAEEAGLLLGKFHCALADLEHTFLGARVGVHDTQRHLRSVERALEEHCEHPRYDEVEPIARDILTLSRALSPLPDLAPRAVHGDPKISNLIFDRTTGAGISMIDLDTLSRMALPLELGDALRSWCNPSGEDHAEVEFSLPLFGAAVSGYARAALSGVLEAERSSIVVGTETIIIELAARFIADALNENYFGWDPSRFKSRGEHNQVRALGQLSLARSLFREHARAEETVLRAFDTENRA